MNFNVPGEHYFFILMSSAKPFVGGSYPGGDAISTLLLEGVSDQNVRILEFVLDTDLLGGTFRAVGTVDQAVISGRFDC